MGLMHYACSVGIVTKIGALKKFAGPTNAALAIDILGHWTVITPSDIITLWTFGDQDYLVTPPQIS